MRISINRCKRIVCTVSLWTDLITEQLHFRHPARGYALYLALLFMLYFFDWNRLPEYFLFVLLLIALWMNPTVKQVAR
jgi:hypothetical protein